MIVSDEEPRHADDRTQRLILAAAAEHTVQLAVPAQPAYRGRNAVFRSVLKSGLLTEMAVGPEHEGIAWYQDERLAHGLKADRRRLGPADAFSPTVWGSPKKAAHPKSALPAGGWSPAEDRCSQAPRTLAPGSSKGQPPSVLATRNPTVLNFTPWANGSRWATRRSAG